MSITIGSTSASLSVGTKRPRDQDEKSAQTVKGESVYPSLLTNYDVLGHITESVGFSEMRLREVSKELCAIFDEHRHHLSLTSCPSSASFMHYIKKAPHIKTI